MLTYLLIGLDKMVVQNKRSLFNVSSCLRVLISLMLMNGATSSVFESNNVKTKMNKSLQNCIIIALMNTNAKGEGKIKVNFSVHPEVPIFYSPANVPDYSILWCWCERVVSPLHNKPVTFPAY